MPLSSLTSCLEVKEQMVSRRRKWSTMSQCPSKCMTKYVHALYRRNSSGRGMGTEVTLGGARWGADRWGENRENKYREFSSIHTLLLSHMLHIYTQVWDHTSTTRYFFRGAFPDQPTSTVAHSQSPVSLPTKPRSKAMDRYWFVWLFYLCHSLFLPLEVP